MAKVYSSQNGVMRGRVGSTVYRKGQNATTASQYQPQVSNPKSDAQCIQRAAFNTAVQAQSALASIVDHSHKSLSGKRANLQRFVKDNAERLRAIILADYYETANIPELLINLKGVSGIQPAPYRVSEGSLPFRPTTFVGGSDTEAGINIGGSIATGINSQETYAAVLRNMGLAPGDQLSLILVVSAGELAGSYSPEGVGSRTYKNYQCHVLASRVTFKAQIPEGFSGELRTDNRWNPDLVVTEEGDMAIGDSTTTDVLALTDGRMMAGEKVLAAVVVRSALDINGKFDYSTSTMVAAQYDAFDLSPEWAAKSYGPGQSVRLGDQPFLDNPIQAASTAGSSPSASASATFEGTALPASIDSKGGVLVVSGLPAEPTDVRVTIQGGGQSINLMGAQGSPAPAIWSGHGYALEEAPQYSNGTIRFSIAGASGDAALSILGGYAFANGKRYTF